jgi:hypothetical protein
MPVQKSETLNMRVKPQTKQALRLIADREKRSMANALECLVDEYVARNHLDVPRKLPDHTLRPQPAHGGVS